MAYNKHFQTLLEWCDFKSLGKKQNRLEMRALCLQFH